MKREIFHVDKHNIDDYAKSYGHWIVDGDVYEYIETCKLDPDSKWQTVIVQRESDRKYFMFEWGFAEGIYFYEPIWREVMPFPVTKIEWKWEKEQPDDNNLPF